MSLAAGLVEMESSVLRTLRGSGNTRRGGELSGGGLRRTKDARGAAGEGTHSLECLERPGARTVAALRSQTRPCRSRKRRYTTHRVLLSSNPMKNTSSSDTFGAHTAHAEEGVQSLYSMGNPLAPGIIVE